jgi:hypothetical protein
VSTENESTPNPSAESSAGKARELPRTADELLDDIEDLIGPRRPGSFVYGQAATRHTVVLGEERADDSDKN